MEYTRTNFEKILRKYLGDKVVNIQMTPPGGGLVYLIDYLIKEIWYRQLVLEKEEDELIRKAYHNLHYALGSFEWDRW
jgi:hypothetical protein